MFNVKWLYRMLIHCTYDYEQSDLCPCQSPPCDKWSHWGIITRDTKLRSKRTLYGN